MDVEKLIDKLRTESLYKDKCALEIMDLCMEAAEALERLNNFGESQSAKLLAELKRAEQERDQMAGFVECFCDADVPEYPDEKKGAKTNGKMSFLRRLHGARSSRKTYTTLRLEWQSRWI